MRVLALFFELEKKWILFLGSCAVAPSVMPRGAGLGVDVDVGVGMGVAFLHGRLAAASTQHPTL